MEKKLLLLYNPVSGKAQIKSQIPDIINTYTKHGYVVTVHPTQAPGDGYEYIKKSGAEYDFVSVCGGDGMLNEAVSSLMCIDEKKKTYPRISPCRKHERFCGNDRSSA